MSILIPSKRAVLWPIVIAAMIFLASSRSRIAAPDITGTDKVGHFLVYGLLGTLVVRNWRLTWKAALGSVVLVSLYGVSDEWHQSFTPGRSVEVADWLADTSGAALAIALYTFWPGYRRTLELPIGPKPRVEIAPEAQTISAP